MPSGALSNSSRSCCSLRLRSSDACCRVGRPADVVPLRRHCVGSPGSDHARERRGGVLHRSRAWIFRVVGEHLEQALAGDRLALRQGLSRVRVADRNDGIARSIGRDHEVQARRGFEERPEVRLRGSYSHLLPQYAKLRMARMLSNRLTAFGAQRSGADTSVVGLPRTTTWIAPAESEIDDVRPGSSATSGVRQLRTAASRSPAGSCRARTCSS